MNRPGNLELALLAVRRTIGLWAGLSVLYLAGYYLFGYPFPTPRDVLAILVVVALGVVLGVAFSFASPFPRETGLPRIVRTGLIVIPALGIGIALQLFIEGVQGDRAYYAIFALAAWLGSTFITEDETDDEEGADAADYDVLGLGR